MTIAELFVNLGVKGDGQAQKAMTGVKTSLGDMSAGALAAKAAIVGAIYALQRLMSNSASAGMGLQQFANFTGLSAENLQRWQYAARQAGVSSEELTGSVKAVQTSISNMLLGKGAPEGMAMVTNTLAKMGKAIDPTKMRDTFYMMGKLQEFARATAGSPDVANRVLASFGLSEGTIQAMRKNAFNRQTLAQAPIYSDRETSKLAKVDVAWSNLGAKIQMAIGHLTAKHGMTLVQDVSKLADQVLKLADAFVKLAEKLKFIQIIGKAFEGWTKIFGAVTDIVNEVQGDKGGVGKGLLKSGKNIASGAGEAAVGAWDMFKDFMTNSPSPAMAGIAPSMKSTGPTVAKTQNINVNQNLNFQHEGKDAKKLSDSVQKSVVNAHRQMSAQLGGG